MTNEAPPTRGNATEAADWGLPQLRPPGKDAAPTVDIVLLDLDIVARTSAGSVDTLPAHERARWERLHFAHDRERFANSRIALRRELARRTGVPANRIALRTGRYGRLCLNGPSPGLDFNLSHSGRWFAIASSSDTWVGIDVEPADRTTLTGLEDSVLAPDERATLNTLPQDQRPLALLGLWTAKEAFMKLNATGLMLAPPTVLVQWHTANAGTASCSDAPWFPRAALLRRHVAGAVCTLATAREAVIAWHVDPPVAQ